MARVVEYYVEGEGREWKRGWSGINECYQISYKLYNKQHTYFFI